LKVNFHHSIGLELRDASLNIMGVGRPEGRHQSELVKAMKEAAGENVSPISGEDDATRPQAGFLWEIAMEWVLLGCPLEYSLDMALAKYFQEARPQLPFPRGPIEKQIRLCLDDVHMTPDGYDREQRCLEQYKWTWKSMRKWSEGYGAEEYFWPWLVAEKNCLWALSQQESELISRVRFYTMWTMGDYSRKPGGGPQVTVTEFEFTADELEENWRKSLVYKKYLDEKEKAA
jgi:hypothetical protein